MTSFQAQVKKVVKKIPVGSIMTYKEVAIEAGYPNSFRAVANIMAKNFDPSVPCNRVIRSDGKLGGYNRGGEQAKRALLLDEGCSKV